MTRWPGSGALISPTAVSAHSASRPLVDSRRARRVLRPGELQWPGGPGAIRDLRNKARFMSFRTVVFDRRGPDLGSELDRNRHARADCPVSTPYPAPLPAKETGIT